MHDEEMTDEYGWLNNRENPLVLEYIEKENEYSENMLKHTKPLQTLLYKEFVARLDESGETAKTPLGDGWVYYSKKIPAEEYPVHCRSRGDGTQEEIYLDENNLSSWKEFEDASYFKLNFVKHSLEAKLVAFAVDSTGQERNTVFFMNIDTKELMSDRIEGVYEHFEYSQDGLYCYYTLLDDYERAYKLMRHEIGSCIKEDETLYHEPDEMFFLSLSKSCNGQYIVLNSAAQITSETRFLSAADNQSNLILLFPKIGSVQYTSESHGDHFYTLTNEDSKNNWLFRTRVQQSEPNNFESYIESRETVIEHRDFVLIEDFGLRRHHLIVFERSNCLQNVRIVDLRVPGFSAYHYISFSEQVYSLWPGSVKEEIADLTKAASFDTDKLRFTYTSFVQPKQVIDYNMDTRIMEVIHEEKVNGIIPYDMSLYTSKRLFATGVGSVCLKIINA